MPWLVIAHCILAFLLAMLIGTLVEYGVHRLMHARVFLYKIHAQHHQSGQGQGWFWEFRDYFLPSTPVMVGGFLLYWTFLHLWSGVAFAFGCVVYAALAAYAHQVQHENPALCFWMKRPIHHLHHHGKMWHHNFGILVDIWDRVFGTYKSADPSPQQDRERIKLASFFRIKWF